MRRAAILTLVLASGLALAQAPAAAGSAPVPPAPETAAPEAAPRDEAALAAEEVQGVPDAQKLERSQVALGRMREVVRDTVARMEEARRVKDVVRLNCVHEKLTQLNALLVLSEKADAVLREAVGQGDTRKSAHELGQVLVASRRTAALRAEAEACIGQLAFRTDALTHVEVKEPAALTASDPTDPPLPADATVRPPPASPTQ